MSQNGKGDADSRVQNRDQFNRNHVAAYGEKQKVDGRRTVLRVGSDGKLYDPRECGSEFIAIDPTADTTYSDHLDFLQERYRASMGASL